MELVSRGRSVIGTGMLSSPAGMMFASSMKPTVIAIDWSGAKQGSREKIWLAAAKEGRLTRLECGQDRGEITTQLIELAKVQPSLVVGIDFAFSVPAWFIRGKRLRSAYDLWELVERHGEDWLRECPPPFWGRKGKPRGEVQSRKPQFRRTEGERVPVKGVSPKSVFQVGGAGSVGTGSLRGMPCLSKLREAGYSIWPFDPPRLPMIVEIYPRYLTGPVVKRDAVARRLYLAHYEAEIGGFAREAASSEDAFDAAVSALVMERHADEFSRLEGPSDRTSRLEGRIWAPLHTPFSVALERSNQSTGVRTAQLMAL